MKQQPPTTPCSPLSEFSDDGDKGFHGTDPRSYRVKSSRWLRMVDWYHVSTIYLPSILIGLSLLLTMQLGTEVHQVYSTGAVAASQVVHFFEDAWSTPITWKVTGLFFLGVALLVSRNKPVYILDFAVWEPPSSWRVSHRDILNMMKDQGVYNQESLDFTERVLENSGTGDATGLPPGIVKGMPGSAFHPPGDEPTQTDSSIESARKEAETIVFDVVKDVLARTKTLPKQIDILIVNCSLFSPTPSLCAMVAHHFGMRSNLITYNLSGMGCSASVISIGLAKDLLTAHPNCLVLVVSTENITQNLYRGNERGMLLQNTLFRCGGAAILLSNKWTDAFRARFKLLHVVRSQLMSDQSYETVWECQDAAGQRGVRLSKDIVKVAGLSMEKMFTALGPDVLPLTEQAKVVRSMVWRYMHRTLGLGGPRPRLYTPDFTRGIEHFCIHAGGRAVIDGVEKNLDLKPHHTAPSRWVLRNYGNTSSSSVWYELDHIRKQCPLHRGHRVLQVGFGSGFKCNGMVWLCLKEPKATA